VEKIAGDPKDLPAELAVNTAPEATAVWFEDASRIPFPAGAVAGGSSVLTSQSQCAFKAFATARLGAEGWEPAQAGLSAKQRGQLLHAVLNAIWSGPPAGLRSHGDLVEIEDLRAFVEGHVQEILNQEMPASAREQMPRRYWELEATRLVELLTEWLRYEAARAPFEVTGTEVKREEAIAGLALKLRLDRVDRLNDGSFLVIDYKTGDVSPKLWEMPRPDDVQLPLYAGFALERETQPLGGLVFAKVRAGNNCFAGRVGDAKGLLLPGIGASTALVKRKLEVEDLLAWRHYIERMAHEFLEGRADVDPREFPATCDRCGLQAVCRIAELRTDLDDEDENYEEE
jgi:ATP-dependent helicase/DNAse subunit B